MKHYANGQELPMNRWANPVSLLYSIPNQAPTDVISLLSRCGIDVLINDPPLPPSKPNNPCRDLAAYVLLQAIHDAHGGSNRKDRAEARAWLLNDNEWFPWWCRAIDLNPTEVRQCIANQFNGTLPRNRNRIFEEHSNAIH